MKRLLSRCGSALAGLALVALAAGRPAGAAERRPARILPLGDSITQGRKGGGQFKMTFSYRYALWKMTVDAGADVDFVGSLQVGFNGDPEWKDYKGRPFDRDHEGHWGWTTRGVREKLPGWMEGRSADIALVLLGTNDGGAKARMTPDETKDEMGRIIDILRERNPKVVVLIGQCFQEWKPFPELRGKMDGLAREKSTDASPVVTVDHSVGWVSNPDKPGTHTVDWVHPNEAGDEKLARNWFEAIKPYLRKLGALK